MVAQTTVTTEMTFVNGCISNYFRRNNICNRMRAGRGALLHDSPTSPQDTTQGGGSIGRGFVRAQRKPCPLPALRRRKRKPAPCLRCAPMCPMSPRAAGEGSLGLCAGGGLAGDGDGGGRRGAGLECARAPRPMLPPPCPHSPTDGGRGAERAPPCPHATLSPTIPDGFYRRSS